MFTKLAAGVAVLLGILGSGATDPKVTRQELSFKEVGSRDIRNELPSQCELRSFAQAAPGPAAFA